SIFDDYDKKIKYIEEFSNLINDIKGDLNNEIEELKYNLSYRDNEIDKTIESIKSSLIDKDEFVKLYDSEKELLNNQIEDFKEEFELLKSQTLRANEIELPSLFDEEKERIENMFEDFSKNLLNRVSDNESDLTYIKNHLLEEKNNLISQFESLRDDINNIREDNRIESLTED
ncbi:hypothetical protein, partial [Brachyspira aalborgi]